MTVSTVEVECDGQRNLLSTGWRTRDFDASRGLDFAAERPVMVRLTHLDHRPFRYNIKVRKEGIKKGLQKGDTRNKEGAAQMVAGVGDKVGKM